mmetsp:Transcript_25797/g.50506  ORF Transcript_25797/g.50506 Transcript_25797/m.50506 type:complete len:262 (+) Transcript_25797:139-924(+)
MARTFFGPCILAAVLALCGSDAFRLTFLSTPVERRPRTVFTSLAAESGTATTSYTLNGKEIRGPLQPLGEWALIKRREGVEKTAGGLYLPSESKVKEVVGQVVALGDGSNYSGVGEKKEPPVAVGDWVLYGRQDGQELEYNGEDHLLIPFDSLVAKLPDKDPESSTLQPLGDFILVKLLEETKTSSGLIIQTPSTAQNTLKDAEVVSAGPGAKDQNGKLIPVPVSKGDRVRFADFANEARDFEEDGNKFSFVRAFSLLAKW